MRIDVAIADLVIDAVHAIRVTAYRGPRRPSGSWLRSWCCAYRSPHADPKRALAGASTVAGWRDVIRKIRDTSGGDFNVCYIATRISVGIPGTFGAGASDLRDLRSRNLLPAESASGADPEVLRLSALAR